MARWLLIPAVALMASCSASYHLKRAIAKVPSILKSTAVRFYTIVVTKERKLTDTIVMNKRDTITIERDRVRVRLVRSYDTLMVEGTCLPDTIKIDVIREVPQLVQRRSFVTKGDRVFGWLLFVAVVLAFVLYIAQRTGNRWY
jgi:hypothetical protein